MTTALSISAFAGNCLRGNCYSGTGIYQFESGGKYQGAFRNGKMHGSGIHISKNGNKYEGRWYYGRRQGKGTMRFSNGDVYVGNFKNDQLEGFGNIRYRNGDSYEGHWKNNKAHGKGTYLFHDGDSYQGHFAAGKFHGQGKMKYADGSAYDGYWAANKKHGRGLLTAANGRSQSGSWSNGKYISVNRPNDYVNMNKPYATETNQIPTTKPQPNRSSTARQGVYTFSDGTEFIGTLVNGLPNGKGKIYFKNGDRYEGQWKHHAQNGRGTITYASGRQIEGKWANGKLIQTYTDSHQYINDANNQYGDVKVWAVLVGVSTYTTMPSLKYTDDDAYRMYAFLKSPEGGAIPDEQIDLLIDEGASRDKIMSSINKTFSKADPNDVVMFYYSGHGLAEAFVPADFDGYRNMLDYKDVVAALDQSQAKNKICIADACYVGGIDNVKSGVRQPQVAYYDAFKKSSPGTAFFLSSRQEEYSLEDHGLRSGVFSHYLIKALKGDADRNANGIVTIQEAFDYVGHRVKNYTHHKQTPMLSGNYDPNIPLSSLK